MKQPLPKTVISAEDIAELILEIKMYARWFSHESIKTRTHARHSSEPPHISAAALELLFSSHARTHLTTDTIEVLIATLEDYQKNAPSITVTLAAPPTQAVKEAIVEWCRHNLTPHILVRFDFNTTLLGGMVIRSGSHIFDWSFKRQILSQRRLFPEVLRRV